ncbi:metallophosphoesterase family protein [Mangrovibacterium diazotrophicum]|uniref:Calcineurin-like phosphoesterase family protein n=1 Tax=Mangrovibacterium diazotrophicum TaxID=1261403 RepID=A0A419W8D3_9BACT|nr:metallophosphoesterase [Mangrovibacterium diazotrophicum]RKD91733.1 calcineurin-like phosphoesterase family protein [Mangrovibacterium diazotrophicum]
MKTINYHLRRGLVCCTILLLLSSCELFEYHPYDTQNFSATDVNATNIAEIELQNNHSDTLHFVFTGDTQRYYDETEEFVDNVNKRDDIDFVIHGGDITDFGLSKEYKWMYDILNKLDVPFVTVIGNHDVLGHGKDVYLEVFGDYNFSFISHRTRFICLNTNALEFDYATAVPDFDYMSGFLNDSADVDQTIVVMHAPPNSTEFNNNASPMFNYIIERYKNVRFCIHGHNHKFEINDFFDNGILYYGCEDISRRSYLVFTVTPDSYSYTLEQF